MAWADSRDEHARLAADPRDRFRVSGLDGTLFPVMKLRHWIGGEWRAGSSGHELRSLNPSDPSDVVSAIGADGADEARAAAQAAAEAFGGWRSMAAAARALLLNSWADAVASRDEEMARTITREVGKPISEARGEVGRCVALLRYYAGEAVRPMGEVIPGQASAMLQYSLRQPVGPTALITPWNFPVAIPIWKAGPALAFGNTVVLKAAEQSMLCASLLAETAQEAGLPAGVFNVVFGSGETAGAALVEAPEIRLVSFTGSEAVGSIVAESCARRNVKYQTEMGGKNVAIVLADADLDRAATLVAGGAMRFAGQKCTATSRVVVEKSVAAAFSAKLVSAIERLELGPSDRDSAAIGPVIEQSALDRLRTAVSSSAGELLTGGFDPVDGALAKGLYFKPTLVAGLARDSELMTRELFGPVLAFAEAADLDEALSIANDTPYGLSASLFTRDIGSALKYVDRIEAGMVRVNGDTTGVDPHAPFGGVKRSGSHSREQGPSAREFYTEIKTVQIQG